MATVQAAIVTPALRELGIVDVTATPGSELSSFALGILHRILDLWNVQRAAVYADVHSSLFTFTAGLNPHTIGLAANSPTWSVTGHRPVSIEGIRITTDNGETFQPPLVKRGAEWWHGEQAPGSSGAYPTDFYFNPTWPNGSIYFWPEPSSGSVKAQLWYRVLLSQPALTDVYSLPPGYQVALVETLKEHLARQPMFASAATPDLAANAAKARAVVFGNNRPVVEYSPMDVGQSPVGHRGVYRHELGPFSLMRRR